MCTKVKVKVVPHSIRTLGMSFVRLAYLLSHGLMRQDGQFLSSPPKHKTPSIFKTTAAYDVSYRQDGVLLESFLDNWMHNILLKGSICNTLEQDVKGNNTQHQVERTWFRHHSWNDTPVRFPLLKQMRCQNKLCIQMLCLMCYVIFGF